MNIKPPNERLSEQFVVRVTPAEAAALDAMKKDGGFPSRNIIEDEATA